MDDVNDAGDSIIDLFDTAAAAAAMFKDGSTHLVMSATILI